MPDSLVELIDRVRSGIVRISIVRGGNEIGAGSGFLVKNGILTNDHVVMEAKFGDILKFGFDGSSSAYSIPANKLNEYVCATSDESAYDYALLELHDTAFKGRHEFELTGKDEKVRVGEKVVFAGFPFQTTHLTAHVGYISSIYDDGGVRKMQIDGSVNGGNSGGPLVDLKTGKVAGIITRAQTGLIERQFNDLFEVLRASAKVIAESRNTGFMLVGGIDPMQAIEGAFGMMHCIAVNLKRSANVGIGIAFSIDNLREHVEKLAQSK